LATGFAAAAGFTLDLAVTAGLGAGFAATGLALDLAGAAGFAAFATVLILAFAWGFLVLAALFLAFVIFSFAFRPKFNNIGAE
jgi:hypothetical protein